MNRQIKLDDVFSFYQECCAKVFFRRRKITKMANIMRRMTTAEMSCHSDTPTRLIRPYSVT